MNTIRLVAAAAAAALLVACGGGELSVSTPAPPAAGPGTVPADATLTARAYTLFVGGLISDERAPPLRVNGVVPPTSETEAALPLS